jgi:hypothetical protein
MTDAHLSPSAGAVARAAAVGLRALFDRAGALRRWGSDRFGLQRAAAGAAASTSLALLAESAAFMLLTRHALAREGAVPRPSRRL